MTNFLNTRRPGNDISARLQRQAAEQQHRTMKGVLSITDEVITLRQNGHSIKKAIGIPLKEVLCSIIRTTCYANAKIQKVCTCFKTTL